MTPEPVKTVIIVQHNTEDYAECLARVRAAETAEDKRALADALWAAEHYDHTMWWQDAHRKLQEMYGGRH